MSIDHGECLHIVNICTSEKYKLLLDCFVSGRSSKELLLRSKLKKCSKCSDSAGWTFLCLECGYFGCHSSTNSHKYSHYAATNHKMFMDLNNGHVWCMKCETFVFNDNLETVRMWHNSEKPGRVLAFEEWEPPIEDISLLIRSSKRRRIKSGSSIGLRGLTNLGSTCFMSCILQSLLHTPVLREYFLSEQHHCTGDERKQCLACEMVWLFQEMLSGQKSPISPHKMLHLVWTQARVLAGYDQQDAHEFFITYLDLLHRHLIKQDLSNSGVSNGVPHNSLDCSCAIHQIFTGALQSDLTCTNCNNISATVEPFWDISLDLVPRDNGDKISDSASVCSSISVDSEPSDDEPPVTLDECLERFTRPERLGSEAKIRCSLCGVAQEGTKQLSLKQIPVVVCIHIKRFRHSKKTRKLGNPLEFPFELDLSPYLTSVINKSNKVKEEIGRYRLFAVVNHMGTTDSGHYINYVLHAGEQWFRCDDTYLTKVSKETVLNSEAYMLFYHKKVIEYS
ncbi:hypothetical protein ACHWQZ_G009736 [Mnemiopsis leidyi]